MIQQTKIFLKKRLKILDLIYHLADITEVGKTSADVNLERDKRILSVSVNGTKNVIKYSKADAKIIFTSTHIVFGVKEQTLELMKALLHR